MIPSVDYLFKILQLKISQYADDLTLILSDPKVAGPKLNLSKREGLLIGNPKNSNFEEYMGFQKEIDSQKF